MIKMFLFLFAFLFLCFAIFTFFFFFLDFLYFLLSESAKLELEDICDSELLVNAELNVIKYFTIMINFDTFAFQGFLILDLSLP